MKKISLLAWIFTFFVALFLTKEVQAYDPVRIDLPVTGCVLGGCPNDLVGYYQRKGERCVTSFNEFLVDPYNNHFWIDDPKITAQGKADERARQFIYWTLNRSSIDDHPALLFIWSQTRNVAFFLFIVVVAVMGIGMIIGQRANFANKIPIWPSIFKVTGLLLYIIFSAGIIIFLIDITDIITKFFIETLGGKDVFNIYFSTINQEDSYIRWIGCRDLNYRVQEGIDAELIILKFTNVTYYVMGSLILLRKILLWFLLFVSPFLALLMPFVFIRNIGWIWIGVFFQWLFYGPLFALFLGALATIWKSGIPFNFEFSRVNQDVGYVFPTGMNILYGGPAQALNGMNNGNYVDTFAEYIITLLMLWAVTFFPWWLLRIFRDYCCEGIYAMKNILLSWYDQTRLTPPGGPGPGPTAPTVGPTGTGTTGLHMPSPIDIPVKVRIETIEQIKKAHTEDITKSLSLSVSKLTDIAHFETDKTTRENVTKNLNFLQNPIKAETPTERQRYMNIRSELFQRAIKEDRTAQHILSSISSSKMEQITRREDLLRTIPQVIPVTKVVTIRQRVPQARIKMSTSTFVKNASSNLETVQEIANISQVPQPQVQSILSSYERNTEQQSKEKVIEKIAAETGLQTKPITEVIRVVDERIKENKNKVVSSFVKSSVSDQKMIQDITTKTQVPQEQVQKVLTSYEHNIHQNADKIVPQIMSETGIKQKPVVIIIQVFGQEASKNIELAKKIAVEQSITSDEVQQMVIEELPVISEVEMKVEEQIQIPPSVSLEDYEQVKRMWKSQYEKGEVPVSDEIKTREDWIKKDIIFITNTLNKLLSSSEELRQEGLDELGVILPIFLINNIKGEELMTYLKAKIEAAKEVSEQIDREREILEKAAPSPEEFVEVQSQKKEEEAKEMTMEEALQEPNAGDEDKPEEKKEIPKSQDKPEEKQDNPQEQIKPEETAKSQDEQLPTEDKK